MEPSLARSLPSRIVASTGVGVVSPGVVVPVAAASIVRQAPGLPGPRAGSTGSTIAVSPGRAAHRAQDERVLHAVTRVEDVVAASQRRVRARAVGVERVDARAADDRVVVAAAVERVVAVAAVDLVVPAVSVEDVVATSARDLVVAAASREPVGAGRADEDVRCVAAVDLFDVGADVVALAGLAVVGLGVEADAHGCGAAEVAHRVVSRPPFEAVGAVEGVQRAVVELVVTVATAHRVVAGTAGETVVADACVELVVVRTAVERVGAVVAPEDVVAAVSEDRVVAGAAHEHVGAAAAVERVVARSAVDLDGECDRIPESVVVGEGVIPAAEVDDQLAGGRADDAEVDVVGYAAGAGADRDGVGSVDDAHLREIALLGRRDVVVHGVAAHVRQHACRVRQLSRVGDPGQRQHPRGRERGERQRRPFDDLFSHFSFPSRSDLEGREPGGRAAVAGARAGARAPARERRGALPAEHVRAVRSATAWPALRR